MEEEFLWSEEDIMNLYINETYLDQACVLLAPFGIIKNRMNCDICCEAPPMNFVKRKSIADDYTWICRKPCNASKSIRSRSIFNASRLIKMKVIIKILYKYIKRVPFI